MSARYPQAQMPSSNKQMTLINHLICIVKQKFDFSTLCPTLIVLKLLRALASVRLTINSSTTDVNKETLMPVLLASVQHQLMLCYNCVNH